MSRPKEKRNDRSNQSESVSQNIATLERWILKFAFLGGSPLALVASSVVLLMSLGASFWIDHRNHKSPVDPYNKLGPVPKLDSPFIFQVLPYTVHNNTVTNVAITEGMRRAFEKDGVIAIRGLIDETLLNRLDEEARVIVEEKKIKQKQKRSGTQFFTEQHGSIFLEPLPTLSYAKNIPESDRYRNATIISTTAFFELSLLSNVPRLAADLLNGGADKNNTVRLLRDIFLAKDTDQFICGWHVDDLGFWPATPESNGVNAWVALDDMPLRTGGGFALAVGSHVAPWKDEAHFVTGASTSFPQGGYKNASDMIQRRPGSGTCNLKTSAPHLHRRMEETKRIYNVQRGDVIFHTRWLFHRTVPFVNGSNYLDVGKEDPIYRRLSIRYVPGSAVIPPGYGTELSVLWDEANGGRTTDDISRLDGPWYPRVWPNVSMEELGELPSLVMDKLPLSMRERSARQNDIRQLLRMHARKSYRIG